MPRRREEATPRYLRSVVDDSAEESYRFEMSMSLGRGGSDLPFVTGAFDGERTQVILDFAAVAEEMDVDLDSDLPSGTTRDDMVVEVIADADTMYARAPMFRLAFAEEGMRAALDRAPEEVVELMEVLADGWASADLATLDAAAGEALPGEAAGTLAGNQGADPSVFLDLVRSAESVEELGADEIDGVPVTGLTADASGEQMLELQEVDPAELQGTEAEGMLEVTFPVEVWIDQRGLVRGISIEIDPAELATASPELADVPPSLRDMIDLTVTLDFLDHGDDSIEIDVPADAVDMTDAFVSLFSLASGEAGGETQPGPGQRRGQRPGPGPRATRSPRSPGYPGPRVPVGHLRGLGSDLRGSRPPRHLRAAGDA